MNFILEQELCHRVIFFSFLCSDQTITIFSRPGILKMAFTCSTGLKEGSNERFVFWGIINTVCRSFFPFLLFRQHFKPSTYFQCDAANVPFNTIASSLQLFTVCSCATHSFCCLVMGLFFFSLQGIARQSIDVSSFACSLGSFVECTVGNRLK